MKLPVSVRNNSFDKVGITKDCQDAVCEYIWNGFEARASKVCVNMEGTPLKESMALSVSDNGTGIEYSNLENTFGAFLYSVKSDASLRIKSQTNKGKGRFSYLSFAPSAEWTTIFSDNKVLKKYIIKASRLDKVNFDIDEPCTDNNLTTTGTTVLLPLNESSLISQLSYKKMEQKLLQEFAWYLYLNNDNDFKLTYLGTELDISSYVNNELSSKCIEKINDFDFNINIIVWNQPVSNSSKIYYLSANTELVTTENTSFNKNMVGFYHAVYVNSNFFKQNMFLPKEDESGQVSLSSESQDLNKPTFGTLKQKINMMIRESLKSFLILNAEKRLNEMEEKGNYPTFSNDEYGQLRKKDFEAVTKELYCVEPKIFYKLTNEQERSILGFLNLLLSSGERENILTIIEQVTSLTPEQRKDFADILKHSQLQYIIDAISIIERRITVVQYLKTIIYDLSKFANERNHIQKIIEQHFWLFGEQYHMLTADKNMKTSLKEYEAITELSEYTNDIPLLDETCTSQRIDIFLYSQRIQEDCSSEMLIVELKAPYVKLSIDVYNQIVRYAHTIRKTPRFNGNNRVWRFYAICSEIENDVKTKYANFKQLGKKGLVDIIENFELYALSWDDIFQSFEARNDFLLSKLKFDYSQIIKDVNGIENIKKSITRANILTENVLSITAK